MRIKSFASVLVLFFLCIFNYSYAGENVYQLDVNNIAENKLPLVAIYQINSGGGAMRSTGASLLCDTSTADTVCEDWDSGTRLTWTDVTTGGTVEHDASHSGTWTCTDKGTAAIEITRNAGDTNEVYSYASLGGSITSAYYHFSIKVLDVSTLTAFQSNTIVVLDSGTDGDFAPVIFMVYNLSGTYYFRIGGQTLTSANASVSMTTNTRYEIGLYVDRGAGSDDDTIELYIDGVSRASITGDELSGTPSYLFIGVTTAATTNQSFNFQIDNVEVDTSAMPSDCPTS